MTDAAERLRSWTHIGGPSPAEEPYRFLNDVKAALAESRAAGPAAERERADRMRNAIAHLPGGLNISRTEVLAILDAPAEASHD